MKHWGRVKLESIAESIDYGVTASAVYSPVGPKFLRITDIQDDAVSWGSVPWCQCNAKSQEAARLQDGDILFARTGATTGKSYLVQECPENAVFASYLIRVRLREMAAPRFVAHFFKTQDYWSQISANVRGVAQPGVNATTLGSLTIPLPPISEQHRLAAILDRAETAVRKRREAFDEIESLEQAIFVDMFGEPGRNEKGWPIRALHELGKISTGGTPPSLLAGMFGGDIPFFTPGDLETERPVRRMVTEAGARAAGTVRAGATLVCCIGATIGKMGMTPLKSSFNQQLNAVEWNGDTIDDVYGAGVLRFFKPTITAWGSSTTLPILKKSSFEKIEIPVPPLAEQRTFAVRMKCVEGLRAKLRRTSQECRHLVSSLQHLAFQGGL